MLPSVPHERSGALAGRALTRRRRTVLVAPAYRHFRGCANPTPRGLGPADRPGFLEPRRLGLSLLARASIGRASCTVSEEMSGLPLIADDWCSAANGREVPRAEAMLPP